MAVPNGKQAALLQRIKNAVLELAPGAEVILYGSRARGDAEPDSDWDVLVLIDETPTSNFKSRIRRRLFDIELESDEIISSIIYSKNDWEEGRMRVTPLHKNVEREGARL